MKRINYRIHILDQDKKSWRKEIKKEVKLFNTNFHSVDNVIKAMEESSIPSHIFQVVIEHVKHDPTDLYPNTWKIVGYDPRLSGEEFIEKYK